MLAVCARACVELPGVPAKPVFPVECKHLEGKRMRTSSGFALLNPIQPTMFASI